MQQGGGLSVHITISTSRFLKEYPLPKKLTVAQYTLTLWTHVYPAGLRYAPAAAGPNYVDKLKKTRELQGASPPSKGKAGAPHWHPTLRGFHPALLLTPRRPAPGVPLDTGVPGRPPLRSGGGRA